jgi:hypothetical protein
MLGLLAASQTACSESADQSGDGTGGAGGAHSENTGGEDSNPEDNDSTGGASSAGTGGENNEGGAGGNAAAVGVTSSKIIHDLSLDDFTELCDQASGVVETHAHCGGFVTGKGFSYDSDIDVFTEHTCRGYNTCTGFSCVLED